MSPEMEQALERLLDAYREARQLALLFDFDGTLAPIVNHPALAELPAKTRQVLMDLARQPRLAIGVLSGRKLDELQSLVGLPDVFYAGTAGLELDLRGTRIRHPKAEFGHQLMAELSKDVQPLVAAVPGAWVENKGLGLTVHYRNARDDLAEALAHDVSRLVNPLSVRLAHGPRALELAPALGWTKGSAVRMIVEHLGPGTVPFYAGDDENDVDALTAAPELGGVALAIGSRARGFVSLRLDHPEALADLLVHFVNSLAQHV